MSVVARHLRFAWFEYQDAEDAISFDLTFSSAVMGWRNVFLDLGGVGDRRFDLGHPTLEIGWTRSKADRSQVGLLSFPLDEHAELLTQWLMSPGVNENTSQLTTGADATDHAELVSISGHGAAGSIWGSTRNGSFDVGDELRKLTTVAPGGDLKYLLLPACYNCSLDAAEIWPQLLVRGNPVHGVLGYAKAYPGDATGARVMRDFGLAMQRNPKITILNAWIEANKGLEWGAVMHENGIDDTIEQWMTQEGLPRLATTAKVIHFDRSSFASGGSVVQVGTPDFEAMWHMADGTEINRTNNAMGHTPAVGLFPGKAGAIVIKANNGKTFTAGQKITLVFYYFRPQKPEMNLTTLLTFSSSLLQQDATLGAPKLRLLQDANVQKDNGATGLVDGVEYTLGAGEQQVTLDYTVVAKATKSYKSDGASRTHGRFGIYVFPPGTSSTDPRSAISMYMNGAYLRE